MSESHINLAYLLPRTQFIALHVRGAVASNGQINALRDNTFNGLDRPTT